MKNLNEVIEALKAQMNEVEAMFNNKNKEITFTKEELFEYTKTISMAVANGLQYELSKKDNFNFDSAIYTKRGANGVEVKVSRGGVLGKVIKGINWELEDENVETTVDTVLNIMNK